MSTGEPDTSVVHGYKTWPGTSVRCWTILSSSHQDQSSGLKTLQPPLILAKARSPPDILSSPTQHKSIRDPWTTKTSVHLVKMVSSSLVRPLQLANRAMQWISAVIVMSITSYFINRNPHGEHIIYQEVIVCRYHSFPTWPFRNSSLTTSHSRPCLLPSSSLVSSRRSCLRFSARSFWDLISSSPTCMSPDDLEVKVISACILTVPPDGWLHSSSLPKTTTGITAMPMLPRTLAAAGRRPTKLSSSLPCEFHNHNILFFSESCMLTSCSFFTLTAIFLEIAGLWADRDSVPTREKGNGHEGAATA